MNRLTSTTSSYAVGERLETTSRVVVSFATRRGAAGFRKNVMLVALRPEVASRDPSAVREFLDAARHFAALSHEAVLPVEDVGLDSDDCPFVVAPPFRGRVLSQLFVPGPSRPRPLAPRVALRVVARIAAGAHALADELEAPLGGLGADAVWVGEGGRVLLLPSVHGRKRRGGGDRPDVHALALLLWDLLVLGRAVEARFDATRAASLPFDDAILRAVMRGLDPSPRDRFVDAGRFSRELSRLADASKESGPRLQLSVMPSPVRSALEPARVLACEAPDPATIPLPLPVPGAAEGRPARLCRVSGGAEHQLMLAGPVQRWVVGRSGASDLVVADPEVSRRHFEIVRDPGGVYRVHDLGSKNGLFVNGAPALERPLSPGDEVRAGDTVLRFDA